MTLIEKIWSLRDWFGDNRGEGQDLNTISNWEAEAKRLFLIRSLKDHDGIKYVLAIFTDEIKTINDQLLNKRQMLEDERYRLLDRRDLALKYLGLFQVETRLEQIEEIVDEEITRLN